MTVGKGRILVDCNFLDLQNPKETSIREILSTKSRFGLQEKFGENLTLSSKIVLHLNLDEIARNDFLLL